VAPTLARLRERGLKLAIVSNTCVPGFVLDRHLSEFGLLEYFPVRIYSCEAGFQKPDARIFELALRQVGVKAADAVFVGDLVKKDVKGAKAVGMKGVLRDPMARSLKHPLADALIREVAELPALLPSLWSALPVDEELVEAIA
jgi:putative hydrolase of the HAD superfamily